MVPALMKSQPFSRDIDIVIQTGYASVSSRSSSQNALTRLASTLRSAGLAEKRKIQVIAARVSILKFNSVHGTYDPQQIALQTNKPV